MWTDRFQHDQAQRATKISPWTCTYCIQSSGSKGRPRRWWWWWRERTKLDHGPFAETGGEKYQIAFRLFVHFNGGLVQGVRPAIDGPANQRVDFRASGGFGEMTSKMWVSFLKHVAMINVVAMVVFNIYTARGLRLLCFSIYLLVRVLTWASNYKWQKKIWKLAWSKVWWIWTARLVAVWLVGWLSVH